MRDPYSDEIILYLNCGDGSAYKIHMYDEIIQNTHTHTSTCKTDEI